ncbi:MAG: thioesterase family protein [Oceanicaulis sp.]
MNLDPESLGWDLPAPFLRTATAKGDDIDVFGHVNNAVYLRWADEAAWAHWEHAGFGTETCATLDRGMAIVRTEADYLGHVREGEDIVCAVWIPASDGRLRAERWYQFRRARDGETVFRAVTKLVCFQLSTGRPARMAGAFAEHYARPDPALAEAAARFMTESKR